MSRNRLLWFALPLLAIAGADASAASRARERAVEQIPELMGRILESQEEIREREAEMKPVVRRYEEQLGDAKGRIESASSESEAAEALVDYVEAYAARIEAQEWGLRQVESSIVRMRADARELQQAADVAGSRTEPRAERQSFLQNQFQGIAGATSELASRLGREEEAATAGAVLHASWASLGALDVSLPELGPESAAAFTRRVEGLYARYRARSNQLHAERRSVRRLLDMLIERQLAQRLDTLFAGSDGLGLGALLSGEGKSQDWQDLGQVVSRSLGLPASGGVAAARDNGDLDRLEYFARGEHRD
jgi:DNA repair exonuclease SbcCD ATPase subunit